MIDTFLAALDAHAGPFWHVSVCPDYWPALARYLGTRGCEYIAVSLRETAFRGPELLVLVAGTGSWAGSEALDRQAAGRWVRLWLRLRRRDECVVSPGWKRVLAPQRQTTVTPAQVRASR